MTFVKIEGHPQISTLCPMAMHDLDHSGCPLWAPTLFATGVEKLTALRPIRYNIRIADTRALPSKK
ncbi:hypothetical protein BB934_35500 (plasmid) [Microvirga ossetica]|uniref:Uncharacterized protein n=1 Tax=Microvirga ossetica TaxID=1882682 RepID=A0A1B2EUB6_9HYPH|nr:hypothetical protein BB934_35500 [Microvirga ossetica]